MSRRMPPARRRGPREEETDLDRLIGDEGVSDDSELNFEFYSKNSKKMGRQLASLRPFPARTRRGAYKRKRWGL